MQTEQAIQLVVTGLAFLVILWNGSRAIVRRLGRYIAERDERNARPVEQVSSLVSALITTLGAMESRRISWRTDDHESLAKRDYELSQMMNQIKLAIDRSDVRAEAASATSIESADRLALLADKISQFDPLFQGMLKIAEDQVAAIMKLTAAVESFSKIVTAPAPTSGAGDFLPGSESDPLRAQAEYDRQIREAIENPAGRESW